MSANTKQVGGDHYHRFGNLQHWDVVHHFGLDYFQGQITRYVFRWRHKGGIEDLRKARHYLDKYIELQLGKDVIDSKPTLTKHVSTVNGRTIHDGAIEYCSRCTMERVSALKETMSTAEPRVQGYVNQDGEEGRAKKN